MVAKLNIEAGDTVTNADLLAFLALATAEQQLIFCMDRGVQAQQTYNTTEPIPDPLINRVAVVPGSTGMAAQMASQMAANAPTLPIYEAATTFGAGETPLASDAGNTVSNAALNTFLGLTLAGQICYLAARIQSAESTYNTANPDTPLNNVSIGPNYDQNSVAVSVLLPLAGSSNAALVGALPY